MRKVILLFLSIISLSLGAYAQPGYQPTAENLKARTQFQDNKFGIFLHWGVYSMLATGEWTMHESKLNYKQYSKLAGGFYPSKFNAAQWVSAIKASGAKYICITTRHHDGFSMFNSKFTDYNIVKATPFKRDILKELADECAKQGIRLHFYYSLLDWYREDYPWGRTGHDTGRPNPKGDWESYYQFMNNQLSELLTNYGSVGAIWFDGWWDHDADPSFNWEFPAMYSMIHKLQPSCLIGNNHHQTPFEGEDFQIFERDVPGENKAGLSGQSISRLPLETCETMNGMWGYKIADQNYKSTDVLIKYLVNTAGRDANLLMNIGPQPNGELPDLAVQRLKEIGEWMQQYGPTIYGTRGGIIPPQEWGATTQKGNKLYIHILNLKDNMLSLSLKNVKVKKAVLFKDQSPVHFTKDKQGITLKLNEVPKDIDYVVELTIG